MIRSDYFLLLEKLNKFNSRSEISFLTTENGLVVLESTYSLYGFYSRQSEIEELFNRFEHESAIDPNQYRFVNHGIDNKIGLEQLAGLQYYNQAVKSFNNHDFDMAGIAIDKALEMYDSLRIWEMQSLITMFTGATADIYQD